MASIWARSRIFSILFLFVLVSIGSIYLLRSTEMCILEKTNNLGAPTLLTPSSIIYSGTPEKATTAQRYHPPSESDTKVTSSRRSSLRTLRDDLYVHEKLPLWHSRLIHNSRLQPLEGNRNVHGKYLTIGISTVYREQEYIKISLKSLVDNSMKMERNDTVVVIYLADTDSEKRNKQLCLIRKNFQEHLDSGFFIVIESKSEIYPPMDFALTKRTFDDTVDRVIWRAKQVIDFAFVFNYSISLSQYYLVMEDDIITSNGYITAIRDFVTLTSRENRRWIALEFSGFLGIGLLFKTSDLPKLVKFLLLFYQEQPVDMLMREFISLEVPDKSLATIRKPSIFQHIGLKSTLPNKIQIIVDRSFAG